MGWTPCHAPETIKVRTKALLGENLYVLEKAS